MKLLKLYIAIMLLVFTSIPVVKATHLMGGDFKYEYLGKSGNLNMYRITIEMYRDCYNSTTPFDFSISVGIYNNNANRSLYTTESINLSSETVIEPPSGGSTCTFKPTVCIRKGLYTKTIFLPNTATGFHLMHSRCCRNNLNNILYNIGQTYYVFIPPTTYNDNSPYFSGIPTPYICAQDTVNMSYAATDVDGDSLVYSLVWPYAGGTDQDPIPVPPAYLSLPVVTYASSYSLAFPFGSAGVATINPNTGLVKVMCPQAGLFAIAVEVKAYRNNTLLTVVRRDVELIVLNCPVNYLPKLAIPGGITSYVVDEGNSISFDIPYTDKDSMYMTATGDVFGTSGSVPAPHATLSPAQSKDTVRSTFTWNTTCDHGRYTPYFFTVNVRDNGCPYKTTITIFQVIVNPFEGLDSVSGPKNVCEFDDSVTYTAFGISSSSLVNWVVAGGSILSGLGTNSIKVRWGSSGLGSVKVYETSQYGCGPVLKSSTVTIHPLPVAEAGKSVSICSGDTLIIGDTASDPTHTYRWNSAKFLDDSTSFAPSFYSINKTGNPVVYTYYLQVISKSNCISNDSIQITVYPEPNTSSINGPLTPCFLGTFKYNVSHTANSEYYWSVTGGVQTAGGLDPEIDIHWTDSFKGSIQMYEINKYNCVGDTQHLDVEIVRTDATIYGPDVVCPNTVDVEYWVKSHAGSSYDWFVTNGIRSDHNGNGPLIKINWPDSGLAMIKVVETTKEGCISDTFYFPVIISYHLKTSDIEGDTFVCAWTDAEPYNVINTNGSTYNWVIDGGLIISGNGKSKIFTDWGTHGLGMLKVLEMSYDSVNDKICLGDTVYQPVVINPIPVTSPINGRMDICEYDTTSYQVIGFPGSSYFWTISDTNIKFSGQGSDQIEIYWQKQGDFHLQVVELTKDSCGGDIIDTIVSVHPNPVTSQISGDDFICFPNNKGVSYSVKGFSGSVFTWGVTGGYIAGSNGDSAIQITWTTVNLGNLYVQEITEWGCIGPIISKTIQADSLAPVMELVTTRQENDLEIQVFWDIVNDFHLNKKVALFKNSANLNRWIFIDSFEHLQREYLDKLVKTHDYSFQYKIAVENLCGDIYYSHPHNSILLDGEKITDFDLNLHWTEYVNWPQGVNRYELFRRVNSESVYKLVESVNDTLLLFEAGLNGITQCYRVAAVREGQEFMRSWSNESCFEFKPILHVPNAFTPNEDGINDTFKVVYANIAYFEMSVFNRWGELIFLSDNPDHGWDGRFNGNVCPLDVYLVVIKYKGNSGQQTYTGNITLIR